MLHLHRAERADRLVAALADLLAVPAGRSTAAADPLQPELLAVHSRGIERWLAQELSSRLGAGPRGADGVCANVEFPFPWQLLGRVLAATHDLDADTDPWAPPRLVWPLLEVVDAGLAEERLAPLRAHFGDDPSDPTRRGRRFTAVRHVADLFDRYAVHRPHMLRRWWAGSDVDGTGGPLPADASWQPDLWRALRTRVGVPSLAERLDEAVARLRAGFVVPDLPPRLALFGLTALPVSYVDVLAALAVRHDVHLFLLHPSPVLWERVSVVLDGAVRAAGPLPRERDETRGLPRHPLLASWGRDAREMQVVLAAPARGAEEHHPLDASPVTLLEHLQAGVRRDEPPPGPPAPGALDRRAELSADDRSLQVHACHGRTRQVEVLRDALLHRLAVHDDLEPRDVVVMCPDIEAYAPIIQAVFGAVVEAPGAAGGVPDLRVRLADRSIRQTNPVLRVVSDVLALADGRLTASEVLDLAGREPVRRRFRFDDDDLERIESWVADARIRWGLDGEHRSRFGLDGVAANTWRSGLDRLLLGVAMADEDDRLVGATVPLDDVEGGRDVALAGRLAELLARIEEAVTVLRGPHAIAGWCEAIRRASDLLTETGEQDRWQHVQLHRILDELAAEATWEREPCALPLALAELRSLLDDRLAGRPSRANHRTGDLTFCTLVPMRSVPHAVVGLLGMDDAAFPRRVAGDGDDLVERAPCVGDRDPRTEDRQLLLDALLAAGRALVVTYTGRDERTNEPLPPAVPIGELLDCVDHTARTAGGAPARGRVLVVHPLQATDDRNFTPGTLGAGDRPWGFDPVALAGARTRASGTRPRPAFLAQPLPPDDTDPLALDELVRFFEHPVKAFLRRRLGVVLPAQGDEPGDAIPVELDGLERYEVGDRLLAARLAGADPDRWAAVERARGVLPPGALAAPVLEELGATVDALVDALARQCDLDAGRHGVDVDVTLPDGRTLLGTVPGVCGDAILTVGFSRVGAKHRLAAWVRLVAATAAHPERPLRAVTVGRHRNPQSRYLVTSVCLDPLGPDAGARRARAAVELACLLDLHDRGLRTPLPLACRTALAYAEAVHEGRDPEHAADQAWSTTWSIPREDRDPEHRLVYGDVVPFEALLGAPPWPDEDGPGWALDERSRFGRCARRLWEPILTAEEVDER